MEFDEKKHPELAAMVTISNLLEPFCRAHRARLLAAVTIVQAPRTFSNSDWSKLIETSRLDCDCTPAARSRLQLAEKIVTGEVRVEIVATSPERLLRPLSDLPPRVGGYVPICEAADARDPDNLLCGKKSVGWLSEADGAEHGPMYLCAEHARALGLLSGDDCFSVCECSHSEIDHGGENDPCSCRVCDCLVFRHVRPVTL
jgi:hypothetical protein